jgi:hypothetical protein
MSLFKKAAPTPTGMTNQRLGALIAELASDAKGEPGYWQFAVRERDLLVLTDAAHNRMRIMAPIIAEGDLDAEDLAILLGANFGRALDAKYALNDGVLWSVYMHPLAELTEAQFRDGVEQVATLADNFGTSFASSNLSFGER